MVFANMIGADEKLLRLKSCIAGFRRGLANAWEKQFAF